MRILYITPFVPWPVRLRSYNLIPRLSRRNEIFLLCSSVSNDEDRRAEALRAVCREVRCVRHSRARGLAQCALAIASRVPLRMAYFRSPRMKLAIKEAVAEFAPDVIYMERWRLLPNIAHDIVVPILCDPTDSMLLYNQRLVRAGSWWEKIVGLTEGIKFKRYEPMLATRASLTVYCSHVDLECVRQRAPQAHFDVVSNGVDCKKFFFKTPEEEEARKIIFTGNFKYRPNCHAAEYFLDRVLPLVQKHVPDIRFALVGNHAKAFASSRGISKPNCEVLDYVSDMRPQVASATIAVAPITVAAGVMSKVLEAFATGTVVVATSLACGGLPVRDGEHLLIADSPEAFAGCVVRLLEDVSLRRTLAANARRMVEANCDWGLLAARMEGLLQTLAGAKHAAPISSEDRVMAL
jgi:polysaccharide biosynthesis protein PslH